MGFPAAEEQTKFMEDWRGEGKGRGRVGPEENVETFTGKYGEIWKNDLFIKTYRAALLPDLLP